MTFVGKKRIGRERVLLHQTNLILLLPSPSSLKTNGQRGIAVKLTWGLLELMQSVIGGGGITTGEEEVVVIIRNGLPSKQTTHD